MGEFIAATSQDDHVRVEIYKSCIVEWSDDGRTWHVFRGDQFESDGGVGVFKDFEVPLNATRSYRAYDHVPEAVTVTRREPGYRVPPIEETRARLAVAMAGRTDEETQ